MTSQQQEWQRKTKAEGAVEALEYLKGALCRTELNSSGRAHVEKLLVKYRKLSQ